MNCTDLALAVGDFVDGRLEPPAVAVVEAHLEHCAECRAMAADFQSIRAAALALQPLEPPARVWARVAAGVEAASPAPRAPAAPMSPGDRVRAVLAGAWGWQPLAAAAMLLVVVSSLSWVGGRLGNGRTAQPETQAAGAVTEFQLAEAQYTDAIASLEAVTTAATARTFDDVTSATLRSSLEDIDAVIGDTRAELAREPDNEFSQEGLLDALGSKVALLQDTVALINEVDGTNEGLIQ